MKTKRVIVLPYDEAWKREFEKIRIELVRALGGFITGIEHVGSTSVEGMAAKPCIDIDVVIKDYSTLEDVVRALAEIGYVHEGDLGIKGREAFKYTDKPHLAAHHLYVCPENSEELRRHITFRDFLRRNPEAAKKYGDVKKEAASLYPNDIDKYIEHKSTCIEELYRQCGLINEILEIRKVEKDTEAAALLLDFVKNFSWEEVKAHTVSVVENWEFDSWESPFVAMINGNIVGMVTIKRSDYYPLPDIYPWVSTLFVSEKYRGRRISERLIDFANGYAKENGFEKTYIPTDHSGLYEKYGYRYVCDIVNYGGDTDRLYEKEL